MGLAHDKNMAARRRVWLRHPQSAVEYSATRHRTARGSIRVYAGHAIDAGWAHLSSSMPTKPVTSAVVVAIAGMIFPAICFVRYRSAGVMLKTHSKHKLRQTKCDTVQRAPVRSAVPQTMKAPHAISLSETSEVWLGCVHAAVGSGKAEGSAPPMRLYTADPSRYASAYHRSSLARWETCTWTFPRSPRVR